ncbi:PH domain-containing protein [Tieghemostelium lacteum]|uniref:PH domain-containing protein n=1 Tax=Tieghemostelium lacteum TaxID=361077 RepID=A0A152A5C7_TIELA|nr:PH domain-containing protein [Tieghemostelium lacteum]|eukprot:KYR01436.1 PH domain-containing protein [Tieghemostelium lacteum]
MEYKSGNLYKLGGVGIFKYRKKYWFVLTRTHLQYYNSSEKLSNPIENLQLTDIKAITLIQKDAGQFQSTIGFQLEAAGNIKFVLHGESISIIADWVVKIDGLVHSDDLSESFLDEADRKQLLKILYKNNIKGGIIKTSLSDEEWNYSAIGTLSTDSTLSDEKIDYHWDGEWLKSSTSNQTLGWGRFNGVYLDWYQKDSVKPDIKYFWDEPEKEYTTTRKEFTFKWTRHFLASKYSTGEWIVEGHVPQPVVMFLQLIQYKRNPQSQNNPFNLINGSSSDITSSAGAGSPSSSIGSQNNILHSSSSPNSSPQLSSLHQQLSIPAGKASTIKIAPYTKGNAMLNVSNILFSHPNSSPDSNNSTPPSSLPNIQSNTTLQNFSSVNNNNNNNNIINNINTNSLDSSSSSSSSSSELISRFHSKKTIQNIDNLDEHIDHTKNPLQFQGDDEGDKSTIETNQNYISITKSKSKSNNQLITSTQPKTSTSTTSTSTSTKVNSVSTKQQQKPQENPPNLKEMNQSSTLDLLNDTIRESNKIQTRLSTKLEKMPSFQSSKYGGSMNSLDSINSGIHSSPSIDSLLYNGRPSNDELIIKPSTEDNPIIYIDSNTISTTTTTTEQIDSKTSSSSSSPSPTITQTRSNSLNTSNPNNLSSSIPLGSIIGPTASVTSLTVDSISQSPNGKTQKKPLAKSTSSDKVTNIINQIAATKKSRPSFCLSCSLPITGHVVVAHGNHFHRECFKCFKCSIELGTKTFYRQVDNFVNSGFNSNSTSTTPPLFNTNNNNINNNNSCNNFVTLSTSPSSSPRGLPPPHPSTLNQQKSNNNSLKHSNSNMPKYLCELCFGDFCPVCPGCNNNVMYRCVNAMGKKWHPDHFVCKECQLPLVGSLYFEKNGFPYCQHDYMKLFPDSTIKPIQI